MEFQLSYLKYQNMMLLKYCTQYVSKFEKLSSGCMLLPCLFSFYAEYTMQNARLDESQAEIRTTRRNTNNLRYADDTNESWTVKKTECQRIDAFELWC